MIDHEMWQDVAIYFNGKCFTTYDKEAGKYYYNDPDHLIVVENKDPNDYFDYVAEEHVLSMGFEGPLYALINYPQGTGDYRKLTKFSRTMVCITNLGMHGIYLAITFRISKKEKRNYDIQ